MRHRNGGPAELVLDALTGDDLEAAGHRTRWLQIGEMVGPKISLRASTLRSRAIALSGQGGGSTPRELARIGDVLPQMFRDAAEGKLRIDITRVPLADVHTAWQQGQQRHAHRDHDAVRCMCRRSSTPNPV